MSPVSEMRGRSLHSPDRIRQTRPLILKPQTSKTVESVGIRATLKETYVWNNEDKCDIMQHRASGRVQLLEYSLQGPDQRGRWIISSVLNPLLKYDLTRSSPFLILYTRRCYDFILIMLLGSCEIKTLLM